MAAMLSVANNKMLGDVTGALLTMCFVALILYFQLFTFQTVKFWKVCNPHCCKLQDEWLVRHTSIHYLPVSKKTNTYFCMPLKFGVSCETYHCRSLKKCQLLHQCQSNSRMRIFWNKQCGEKINIVKDREWKRNQIIKLQICNFSGL